MDIDLVLSKLNKVKRFGNRYSACCPVHDDNSPSMSIREAEDRILIYCHACGANGLAVVQALGISVSAIFDKPVFKEHGQHKLLNDKRELDECIIAIAHEAIKRGERIGHKDYRAIKEALSRREQRRKHGLPIKFDMEIEFSG